MKGDDSTVSAVRAVILPMAITDNPPNEYSPCESLLQGVQYIYSSMHPYKITSLLPRKRL